MKKNMPSIFLFVLAAAAFAEAPVPENDPDPQNAIEAFPVLEINMLQCGRMFGPRNELILGLIWYDPQVIGALTYPGTLRTLSLEAGWRHYFWEGLHLEFQLDPQLVFLYDRASDSSFSRFGLVSELRIGYRFEFTLFDLRFYVCPQFFAGYYLSDNRPEPFIRADRDRHLHPFYWSPIPILFLGLRF